MEVVRSRGFAEKSDLEKQIAFFYYFDDENPYDWLGDEEDIETNEDLITGPAFGPIDFIGVERYNFSELKHMTDNFSKDNLILDAEDGKLYRGEILFSGTTKVVTVKLWGFNKRRYPTSERNVHRFINEINLLTAHPKFKSDPRLVDVLGICYVEKLAVVYDLNFKRCLSDLIPLDDFGWEDRLKVAFQLAHLLADFHRELIVLCEFSPAWVMVDENYNVKLFDLTRFAHVKNMDEKINYSYHRKDHAYEAPERLEGLHFEDGKFSTGTDVYSFGVLLFELITKASVWDSIDALHSQGKEVLVNHVNGCIPWLLEVWEGPLVNETFSVLTPAAIQIECLARKCLDPAPQSRIGMDEVCVNVEEIKKLESSRKRPKLC